MSPIIEKVGFLLSEISKRNSSFRIQRVSGLSLSKPKPSPFATAWEHESVSIEEYLQDIAAQADCSDECFIGALCLLKKLEATNAFTRLTQRTVHRIFFTCFLLAMKFIEDEVFSESDHAVIGNVALTDLVEMQFIYLKELQFNCSISAEDIENMTTKVFQFHANSKEMLRSHNSSPAKLTTLLFAPVQSARQSSDVIGLVRRRPRQIKDQKSKSQSHQSPLDMLTSAALGVVIQTL
jgi:hypothetical protein